MTPLEARFKYFEALVRIENLSYDEFQQLYTDYMDSPDGTFSEDEHELLADLNDKFDYTAPALGEHDEDREHGWISYREFQDLAVKEFLPKLIKRN